MLGVGAARRREPRHARVGHLLDRDVGRREEGRRLGPDGCVERERVAEEAVGATKERDGTG